MTEIYIFRSGAVSTSLADPRQCDPTLGWSLVSPFARTKGARLKLFSWCKVVTEFSVATSEIYYVMKTLSRNFGKNFLRLLRCLRGIQNVIKDEPEIKRMLILKYRPISGARKWKSIKNNQASSFTKSGVVEVSKGCHKQEGRKNK